MIKISKINEVITSTDIITNINIHIHPKMKKTKTKKSNIKITSKKNPQKTKTKTVKNQTTMKKMEKIITALTV